jgi:hypothetical protein
LYKILKNNMLSQQKNAELFGNVLSLGVPLYHYFAIKTIFFLQKTLPYIVQYKIVH